MIVVVYYSTYKTSALKSLTAKHVCKWYYAEKKMEQRQILLYAVCLEIKKSSAQLKKRIVMIKFFFANLNSSGALKGHDSIRGSGIVAVSRPWKAAAGEF